MTNSAGGGRPVTEDRSNVASDLLSVRLTPIERALLDMIVKVRAREVADAGGTALSVNSVVRNLITREAKTLGLSFDEARRMAEEELQRDAPPAKGAKKTATKTKTVARARKR